MKVYVLQCYIGWSFSFSHLFQHYVHHALTSCVTASRAFAKKYGDDFELIFNFSAKPDLADSEIRGPAIYRKDRQVEYTIFVPYKNKAYARTLAGHRDALESLFQAIVRVLQKYDIDATVIENQSVSWIQHVLASPEMIAEWDQPVVSIQSSSLAVEPETSTHLDKLEESKAEMTTPPVLQFPENLLALVAEQDGQWDTEEYEPFIVSVLTGTEYGGHEIPIAWQLEFDPADAESAEVMEILEENDLQPNGDGWASVILAILAARSSEFAEFAHSDSEDAACVLWTDREDVFQALFSVAWEAVLGA